MEPGMRIKRTKKDSTSYQIEKEIDYCSNILTSEFTKNNNWEKFYQNRLHSLSSHINLNVVLPWKTSSTTLASNKFQVKELDQEKELEPFSFKYSNGLAESSKTFSLGLQLSSNKSDPILSNDIYNIKELKKRQTNKSPKGCKPNMSNNFQSSHIRENNYNINSTLSTFTSPKYIKSFHNNNLPYYTKSQEVCHKDILSYQVSPQFFPNRIFPYNYSMDKHADTHVHRHLDYNNIEQNSLYLSPKNTILSNFDAVKHSPSPLANLYPRRRCF